MAAALALRLWAVEQRSMSHPEMWAPLIPISSEYADPGQRASLPVLVLHTLTEDTHPPGYYVFLWFWMKAFGSSEGAMRLPSVLFGAGSVVLVYWLGARLGRRGAGLAAGLLLALNGHHIFWSQIARMYSMACFLGLLATVLLVRMADGEDSRPMQMLYAAVLLAGTSSHLFFWGVIAGHMLWTITAGWGRGALPRAFAPQTLAALLGTPYIAFAAYQSHNQVATFSADVFGFWRDYFSFAFLIPNRESVLAYSETIARQVNPGIELAATVAGAVVGVALLALAWRLIRRQARSPDTGAAALERVPWLMWGAAALIAALAIAAFALLREHQITERLAAARPDVEDIRMKLSFIRSLKLLIALPFLLLGIAAAAVCVFGRFRSAHAALSTYSRPALIAMLAFFPLGLASIVSLVRPVLNHRGALLYAPYLLVLLGLGLAALRTTPRVLIPLGVVILLGHAASIRLFHSTRLDRFDFRPFAIALRAQIRSGDLVLMRRTWFGTPLLYYIRPGECNVAVRDFEARLRANPHARVWAVRYREAPEGHDPLANRRAIQTVDGGLVYATLYAPASEQGSGGEAGLPPAGPRRTRGSLVTGPRRRRSGRSVLLGRVGLEDGLKLPPECP